MEEKKFIEPLSDREKFEINERISINNVEIAKLQLENARTQLEIVKTQFDHEVYKNNTKKSFFNLFKL